MEAFTYSDLTCVHVYMFLCVILLQHPFIRGAKPLSVLSTMIQEALSIMEEESNREDNEVRRWSTDWVLACYFRLCLSVSTHEYSVYRHPIDMHEYDVYKHPIDTVASIGSIKMYRY